MLAGRSHILAMQQPHTTRLCYGYFVQSSVVSSTADPPERRGIENFFLSNNEGEKSQTIDVIPQTNQFSSEGDKCNLCLHM